MDQLHEELKEITPAPPTFDAPSCKIHEACNSNSPCPSPSQSEAEYETCDSGVSEQSSLSDEMTGNNIRRRTVSRSPSPPGATNSTNQRGSNQNMMYNAPNSSQGSSGGMDRTGSSGSLSAQINNQVYILI